ncbi:MAG: flagellar hook capping FlgD N-terminal domain-containing protein [Atribacterota bacterium]
MMVSSIPQSDKVENHSETTEKKNVLGKDDFLKLLILQLRTQNPLNPMNDRDFGAQLAQFSTLEATQNMERTMQNLFLLQASSLVGKTVELRDGTGGPVDRVILGGSVLTIEVNGTEYPFSDVVKVG